jgi:hypothetical protein
MAFTAWPFDVEADGTTPQEVTEEQFRHSLAAMSQEGVIPDSGIGGTTALAATALPDSSGLSLTSGYCQVGGYTGYNDQPETVEAPANDAAQPRLYWLVMRLDRTARTITPHIIIGAAAANPVLPALTRTDTVRDLPICQFRRAGSGGGITNVVDRRVFTNPNGSLNTRSNARPESPFNGTRIFESDTNREMVWAGGAWRTVFDVAFPTPWEEIPPRSGFGNIGSGHTAAVRFDGPGLVRLRGRIGRLNENALTSGDYIARLPTPYRPPGINAFGVASTIRNGSTVSTRGAVSRLEIQSLNQDFPGRLVVYTSYNPFWVALDGITYTI